MIYPKNVSIDKYEKKTLVALIRHLFKIEYDLPMEGSILTIMTDDCIERNIFQDYFERIMRIFPPSVCT